MGIETGRQYDPSSATAMGTMPSVAQLPPLTGGHATPVAPFFFALQTGSLFRAGIDLALTWVEEDCGAGLAHEAARELVLFLRRPAGQPQVSVSLASQASEMASIRELQIWIAEHLTSRLSVEDLADRMAMSVRNFERVFTREVGITPSQFVLHLRMEAARRQLERTDRGLEQVAAANGFGSVDGMRRAFLRLLGTTPRRYRELAGGSAPPSV